MLTLSEITNEEISLTEIISKSLQNVLSNMKITLTIINDEDFDILYDIDSLIEEVFPKKEAMEYKPSQILNLEDNPLCIVCLKKSSVLGGITVSFDFEDNSVKLISLAVDSQFRNQKIGSLLMLALHDICKELEITSISLISSDAGKAFYESFAFKEMGHNSFERYLPFEDKLIRKKISSCNQGASNELLDDTKKTKKKHFNDSLISNSIFNSKTISNNVESHKDKRMKLINTVTAF